MELEKSYYRIYEVMMRSHMCSAMLNGFIAFFFFFSTIRSKPIAILIASTLIHVHYTDYSTVIKEALKEINIEPDDIVHFIFCYYKKDAMNFAQQYEEHNNNTLQYIFIDDHYVFKYFFYSQNYHLIELKATTKYFIL